METQTITITEPRPTIMIGTPYYAGFSGKYVLSLAQTIYDLFPRYRVMLGTAESSQLHINRNILIRTAYDNKVDYLMFIDTDMMWLPEYIERLINSKKDVIGGLATTRKLNKQRNYAICVYESDGQGGHKPISAVPRVPFRCWAIGTGFLLITKSVLRRVWDERYREGYPFDFVPHGLTSDKSKIQSRYMGEDLSFSYRLRKMGIDIWCDPAVRPGHMGEIMICEQDIEDTTSVK